MDSPDTTDEVHVCQLCGCWFETRTGLSSHARAHLRQMGIPDSEGKGSPIDLLYQLMEGEDLKDAGAEQPENLTSDGPARSSAKRASEQSLSTASSIKRPKASDDCTCVLCGEVFENRKGLGSHARSHLRHIGVSDLVGKSSAIEAVQELVRSGMLQPVHPSKSKGAVSSSAASSPAPASPATPARSPAPSQSWTPHSPASLKTTPVKSPQLPVSKAPKAKKGFRLAVDPLYRKPKPEPVEMEVTAQPSTSVTNNSSALQKSPVTAPSSKPPEPGIQSPPTVLCDYCGQLFDTRKALSCHARAHLRQLGLTWSIKSSPIELLKEVMMHNEETKKELLHGGSAADRKSTPHASKPPPDGLSPGMAASSSCAVPLDFSMKEKAPPIKDSSCEVCGFYFENRKALASHARAHLRQLGIVEWRTDGVTSPIELLSELIRKDPAKVAQITRRYRTGDLYIKKSHRRSGSPSLSVDSDSVPGGGLKPHMQQQQHEQQHEHRASREDSGAAAGSSRQSQGHTRAMAAHGLASVRSPRGVHPPKHGGAARKENGDSNSQQAPRSGSIPALLPKPPLTPLVKLVGKIYSLKCRFCEEVFSGPLSVQEKWITHLQKHILSLGYKGNASPPATPVTTAALVDPVAV
ncbi:protein Wiz-like isoform X2 [Salarias fasciatus]|uniref:Protein Wiz-like n=1 Tax=Salarias fasciatus TaxID=181472 RepID=A0A672JEH4_SALFA|nr:protein Wiz-like isoform X2 [Salarias fasciatus]